MVAFEIKATACIVHQASVTKAYFQKHLFLILRPFVLYQPIDFACLPILVIMSCISVVILNPEF